MTYIIDNVVISKKIMSLCFSCRLDRCKGACCRAGEAGAPATRDEIIQIEHYLEIIMPRLVPPAQKLIRQKSISGMNSIGKYNIALIPGSQDCMFTHISNHQCTCMLQILHDSNLVPQLKPISCRLFPIREIQTNGFVHLSIDFYNECMSSLSSDTRLLDFCREALISRFGMSFIQKLDSFRYGGSSDETNH
jgi:hypothetical protein